MKDITTQIDFDGQGLIPVIVQDIKTGKVLMLAYMNREAMDKTLDKGIMHYYSRSRKKLWMKGETSGNIQELKNFYYDCDRDCLLAMVEQKGVACHTGNYSCFYNPIVINEEVSDNQKHHILKELYALLLERKSNPKEGSYTSYLFKEGLDKILKKIGEEASEVIIGAKNNKNELIYEISDLVYHLIVLMVNQDIGLKDISEELTRRREK